MRRTDRLRLAAAALAGVVLLGGCTDSGDPDPQPTPGATPRPFTVMSTDPVRATDPAAMTDAASAMLAVNVFQRLMTVEPGQSAPKPDAARDCVYTSPTTVTCTLNKEMTFSNGHALTSSDVKFSIERALRLNVAGSSSWLLSSVRRIETPDPETVRFLLKQVDNEFVFALASPAASILDEESYDADAIAGPDAPIVGSGPFAVGSFGDNAIVFDRFDAYVGRNAARLATVVYRTAADSATVEDAMARGLVDVVWRGLDAAAVTRLAQQVAQSPEQQTTSGFTETTLTGTRVLQLGWRADSPMRRNKGLRQAIANALQGDRTSDSVVPGGVPGHVASFPLGGKVKPKVTWKNRINLTLSYDPTAPNSQDIATQVRTRLENTGDLSVQLRAGDADADLVLLDRKAWTATALAWLQPYVESPLAGSRDVIETELDQYRATTDDATATRLLTSLQDQASSDLTLLPISQSDEVVYTHGSAEVSATSFGPGWQLGLFGMSNG